MKIRQYIYLLLMLLATMLPIGCTDDNEIFSSDADSDKVCWKIGVTLPGAANSTRAFGNENFTFDVNSFYVAVFVDVGGVSYLEEFVKADAEKGIVWNDEAAHWEFGVNLSPTTDKRRLHIIANYPGLTMGFGEEGQLIGRLTANGNNHDVYWNYRDVTKIADGFETQVQNVPLVRNYVQVRLTLTDEIKEDFTLTGYALYNVPTKGTVAPYNPTAEVPFANFVSGNTCQSYDNLYNVQKYEGNEPYDDGTLFSTELKWIVPESDGTIAPTYMYERSNRKASNPTCMIVKGKYDDNDTETYYKLDFVYDDKTTNSKVYYNLLRNFIYTMQLKSVTGEGYDSAEKAIRQPASNNIGGDAVAEDYTNISDGSGRLFVSTTYMLLTEQTEAYVYYKYVPDIDAGTIVNDSVKVTAPAGNVLSVAAEVMGDETSGEYAGWRKLKLTSKVPPVGGATQELTFAGSYGNKSHLQRKIELLLRTAYPLSVNVLDYNDKDKEVPLVAKSPLDVNVTLPTGIPTPLFPLSLFISSEDNTIFPEYGTNMPAMVQNGKYGFIREVSLMEYEASADKVFYSKFLTNCPESETVVNVTNEYFVPGSDIFVNPWDVDNVTLGTSIGVQVQQIYGRYPQKIYGNNGNNNGTETVDVKLNGVSVGTITIDRDNVTSEMTFNIVADGLHRSDKLEFTFSDKYWHGQWSATPITYTAASTLGEIAAGTTLVFTAQGEIAKLNKITITTSQAVTVQQATVTYYYRDYSYYPKKIHNNNNSTTARNDGTESVTVTLNDVELTDEITIDRDNVTVGGQLEYDAGFSNDDVLIFTFSDNYAASRNYNSITWSTQPATYTATCTVGDLLNGTATLNFRSN